MKTLTPKKNPFSMIELVIALVIIVIGVVGIIGLIPPAMDASKDTVSRSNAADAADQFLHFMASEIKKDWDVVNAFPMKKTVLVSEGSGTVESTLIFSSQSLISASNIQINFAAINEDDSFDPNNEGHQTGIFAIKQVTPSNIVDFEGVITAWREVESTDVGGDEDANQVTLMVEIAWPASKPPELRESSSYRLNVFRPSTVQVALSPDAPEATGYEADGCVNVNPANSAGNEFSYTLADGTVTDMTDLSDYYHANGKTNLSFNGGVAEVKVMVKAQGRTVKINGVDTELLTNTRYTFSGNINLGLTNNQPSAKSWGQAKGHWWACISGTELEITPAPPGS